MSVEDEAIGSMIRLSMQGAETTIKIAGSASIALAKILYAISEKIKEGKALTIGEKNLIDIASGNNSEVFTIPKEQLKTFAKQAHSYGLNYATAAISGEKGYKTVDIVIPAAQANIVNHIIEKFDIDGVKTGELQADAEEIDKALNVQENPDVAHEFNVKTEDVTENPTQTLTEKDSDILSEHTLETPEANNKESISIVINGDDGEERESVMSKLRGWEQEYKDKVQSATMEKTGDYAKDVADKVKEVKDNAR